MLVAGTLLSEQGSLMAVLSKETQGSQTWCFLNLEESLLLWMSSEPTSCTGQTPEPTAVKATQGSGHHTLCNNLLMSPITWDFKYLWLSAS